MGTFVWLMCFWCSSGLDVVHSGSMPIFCQLPWQLHIVCTFTREIQWVLDAHLRESKLQPRVPKKSFWDKMLKINHVGGAVWPKPVLEMGAGRPLGLCADP